MRVRQEGDVLEIDRREFLQSLGMVGVGLSLPPKQVDTLLQLPQYLLRRGELGSSGIDLDKLFGPERSVGGVKSNPFDRFVVEDYNSEGRPVVQVYDNANQLVAEARSDVSVSNSVLSPDGNTLALFIHPGKDDKRKDSFCSTSLVLWDIKKNEKVVLPISSERKRNNEDWYIDWLDQENLVFLPPRPLRDSGLEPVRVYVLRAQELFEEGEIDIVSDYKRVGNGRAWRIGINNEVWVRDRRGKKLMLEVKDKDKTSWEFDLEIGKIKSPDNAYLSEVEKERLRDGNVIKAGGDYFLLVGGGKYPIPDFAKYRRNTGFMGDIVDVDFNIADSIKTLEIRGEGYDFDISGDWRRINPDGGVKIELSGGWLTRSQRSGTGSDIEGAFGPIIQGLRPFGFDDYDVLFALYNMYYLKRLEGYTPSDTMANPVEVAEAFSFITERRRGLFPLDKRVKGGHSLGGLFELIDAIRNPEGVKAVFTIDSPLLGIPENMLVNLKTAQLTEAIDDEVVDFLIKINKNQEYRKRLRQGVRYLQSLGIPVYTFCSSDDSIISVESAVLPYSSNQINGKRIKLVFSAGRKLENLFWGHGEPLKYDLITKEYVPGMVGQNFARKAA